MSPSIEALASNLAHGEAVFLQLRGNVGLIAVTRLKLGGETRDMTLLFSDVRGFTGISEGLDAEELTRFLNSLFTPLSNIILVCRAVEGLPPNHRPIHARILDGKHVCAGDATDRRAGENNVARRITHHLRYINQEKC